MKGKPIPVGYKFFVLAALTGFVISFTPDGQHAQKEGKQEFREKKVRIMVR